MVGNSASFISWKTMKEFTLVTNLLNHLKAHIASEFLDLTFFLIWFDRHWSKKIIAHIAPEFLDLTFFHIWFDRKRSKEKIIAHIAPEFPDFSSGLKKGLCYSKYVFFLFYMKYIIWKYIFFKYKIPKNLKQLEDRNLSP